MKRPDAMFHPVYLGPRRGLDVNPYEPLPKERSDAWRMPKRAVRDRAFHTEHLALDLLVDVRKARIEGTATLTLVSLVPALTEVELDAREMRIRGVRAGSRKLRASHADGKLRIKLDRAYAPGDVVTVQIAYACSPRAGFWFVRPDRAYPNRHAQGWSQGQAEDSRFWFPILDHPNDKFTTEIKVTADSALRTVANGKLKSRVKRGSRTVWTWELDTPQPAYLVSLAVAPYVETRAKAGKVPLRFYAFPGQERAARRLYGKTADMVKVFSKLFGPYPYREYSQIVVSEFTWGGMENTGATTLTEKALTDDRAALDISYEGLIAHELAHQWWGDLATCRGWLHNWLNESWATFSENLYDEVAHGEDFATWDRIQKTTQYMTQDLAQYRRPIVTDGYEIPMDLFDRHAYEKGSLVLTMLRDEMGDDAFFRGARTYLVRHAFGFADTHEFRRALEDASGRDLSWFFDQWVFQAGYPEINARWRSLGKGEVELTLAQAQDEGPFRVRLEVEVHGSSGVRRETIVLDRGRQAFKLPCAGRPLRVAIDPRFRVLKRLELSQPQSSWRHALEKAPQFAERMRAARHMEDARSLITALGKDRSAQVRMACALALAEGFKKEGRARVALERCLLEDRDPHARRAAAYALGWFGEAAETALLECLDRERSYLVKAMALKALAFAKSPQLLAAATEAMNDRGWRDLVPMAALDALAIAKPFEAFDLAYASVRYGETQEVREGGVRLLTALALDTKARKARPEQARHVVPTIESLLQDPSVFMKLAAAGAAGKLKDKKLLSPLKRLVRDEVWDHLIHTAQKSLRELEKPARKKKSGVKLAPPRA